MKFRLKSLNIQFRKALERLDLSAQVSFFHGQISTGKSTIARLIDYCLGGTLHSTPALNQEFVSVQLNVQIGSYEALFDREGLHATNVRVTWRDDQGNNASVLAPTAAGEVPIWGDDVYNLSDLLFHLAGITPIKVRRSKRDPNSKLVRLSFRDLMWYCYLEQDDLDSSFFRLEDDSRKYKSRDVMRFIVGFYTEQMNELDLELERVTDERRAKEEGAEQIRGFLEELGYGSEFDIRNQIGAATNELTAARSALQELRATHAVGTHFADEFREKLRMLAENLASEQQTLSDLRERIGDQEQLRAELISAKFKLSRTQAANTVLADVEFELCPVCGTSTSTLNRAPDHCILCGSDQSVQPSVDGRPEVVNRDLDARLEDLEMSLKQHRRQISAQERRVTELVTEKARADRRLSDELKTYDSAFLANAREAERRVASLEEQLRNLEKIVRMPEALDRLRRDIAGLQIRERELRQQIEAEKKKLQKADAIVNELEDTYLQIMVDVGVPGIRPGDTIYIDRLTWTPTIFPNGDESQGYDFYSAGSGGKKTLLNVCYALAVHTVAALNGLPLPTLLMIDSPMKNIGKEVNKAMFLSLYEKLYALVTGPLAATQFIIIDNEFAPAPQGVDIKDRYMPPPLIPGYQGA